MGVFDAVNFREAPFLPRLNTGTMMDVATGSYIPGWDGTAILNGGLSHTNATVGRSQMFKSTTAIAAAVNAYARYPGAEFGLNDTEKAQEEKRILAMADVEIPPMNEFRLTDATEYDAESFFDTFSAMAQHKIKNRKDFMVELPHIDPRTGKPMMMMIPTIIGIDSWSALSVRIVEEMLSPDLKIGPNGEVLGKGSISGSEGNTWAMRDGLIKKKMIREMNRLASQAGIYMFFTLHVGDKIEMNPYAPSPKTLQHMKASDKPKGAGGDFMFLMSNLLDCRSVKTLQGDDKQCLFPTKDGFTAPMDLNQVTQIVSRCKGNASGNQVSMVVSQSDGVLPALSNYMYLRDNKYWGMDGNPIRHSPVLMPEETLQRTTINDKLRNDYKLRRAVELLSQLCYIQNSWTLRNAPVPFHMDPKVFADKLHSSAYPVDDILESRGWWTYKYDGYINPREYLSLYDALAIIDGQYVPKWLQAKTPATKAAPVAADKQVKLVVADKKAA